MQRVVMQFSCGIQRLHEPVISHTTYVSEADSEAVSSVYGCQQTRPIIKHVGRMSQNVPVCLDLKPKQWNLCLESNPERREKEM